MSTAAWAPVDDTIAPMRWWTAVVSGVLASVLLTPVGDVLSGWWPAVAVSLLTVIAVVCGLPPVFARAWREVGTERRFGGAALLSGACALAFVTAPLIFVAGALQGLGAIALATAAHLVAARCLGTMVRVVPGAVRPGALPAGEPAVPGVWTRVDAAIRWMPAAIAAIAVIVLLGWVTVATVGAVPWAGGVQGTFAALSILLVASPASFVLARILPTRAARDRGRELGILFGDVDLLRLARVRSLALDPIGVVTDPRPRLVGVHTVGRLQVTAALQAAASIADGSEHPAHAALVGAARDRALTLRPADAPADTGRARSGRIKDTVVTLGPADAFDRVPAELLDRGSTLLVGWGGVARAGFELVPTVRSEALDDWPELLDSQIRPVFVGHDRAALDHVGSALEMREADLRVLRGDADAPGSSEPAGPVGGITWADVVDDLEADGPVAVVGDHGLSARPDVFVLSPEPLPSEEGPSASDSVVRLSPADFSGAMRTLALARKTSRVTTQGLVLVAAVHAITLPLAALSILQPTVAAVIGAGLPLLIAANALRPRSFARDTPGM